MFKQICRFLSILVISNLLFSTAAFAKSPMSVFHWLFGHKKPVEQTTDTEQKPVDENPNIQQPTYDDGPYVTKYGVYFPDADIDYPPPGKNY
ncbi:MAG: hypothetical protein A2Y25_01765 [Candidatus Melainabacteria bacterium GWF2_37_15]|nr:MAG: hypothetical protein A2Y25_01765 [Candidatus Melainabacteria bacterium GWF2_37_15]